MLNLQVKTKLSPDAVVDRIRSFFGKGGLGLQLTEETGGCFTFQGGGGYVSATVCVEDGKTRVDLLTQEWEHPVKEFAASLG
jgi:hypothetical protein